MNNARVLATMVTISLATVTASSAAVPQLQEDNRTEANAYIASDPDTTEASLRFAITRVEFVTLADIWEEDTAFSSSLQDRIDHWAYQRIISMGQMVLPLIYDRLGQQGGYWFPALRALTGRDPVPETARGNMAAMRLAWLRDWNPAREHTTNQVLGEVIRQLSEAAARSEGE